MVSIEAREWAWKQDVQGPAMRLLLLAIAEKCNASGRCTASWRTICKEYFPGMDQGGLRRHRNALVDAGMLTVATEAGRKRLIEAISLPLSGDISRKTGDVSESKTGDVSAETGDVSAETGDVSEPHNIHVTEGDRRVTESRTHEQAPTHAHEGASSPPQAVPSQTAGVDRSLRSDDPRAADPPRSAAPPTDAQGQPVDAAWGDLVLALGFALVWAADRVAAVAPGVEPDIGVVRQWTERRAVGLWAGYSSGHGRDVLALAQRFVNNRHALLDAIRHRASTGGLTMRQVSQWARGWVEDDIADSQRPAAVKPSPRRPSARIGFDPRWVGADWKRSGRTAAPGIE